MPIKRRKTEEESTASDMSTGEDRRLITKLDRPGEIQCFFQMLSNLPESITFDILLSILSWRKVLMLFSIAHHYVVLNDKEENQKNKTLETNRVTPVLIAYAILSGNLKKRINEVASRRMAKFLENLASQNAAVYMKAIDKVMQGKEKLSLAALPQTHPIPIDHLVIQLKKRITPTDYLLRTLLKGEGKAAATYTQVRLTLGEKTSFTLLDWLQSIRNKKPQYIEGDPFVITLKTVNTRREILNLNEDNQQKTVEELIDRIDAIFKFLSEKGDDMSPRSIHGNTADILRERFTEVIAYLCAIGVMLDKKDLETAAESIFSSFHKYFINRKLIQNLGNMLSVYFLSYLSYIALIFPSQQVLFRPLKIPFLLARLDHSFQIRRSPTALAPPSIEGSGGLALSAERALLAASFGIVEFDFDNTCEQMSEFLSKKNDVPPPLLRYIYVHYWLRNFFECLIKGGKKIKTLTDFFNTIASLLSKKSGLLNLLLSWPKSSQEIPDKFYCRAMMLSHILKEAASHLHYNDSNPHYKEESRKHANLELQKLIARSATLFTDEDEEEKNSKQSTYRNIVFLTFCCSAFNSEQNRTKKPFFFLPDLLDFFKALRLSDESEGPQLSTEVQKVWLVDSINLSDSAEIMPLKKIINRTTIERTVEALKKIFAWAPYDEDLLSVLYELLFITLTPSMFGDKSAEYSRLSIRFNLFSEIITQLKDSASLLFFLNEENFSIRWIALFRKSGNQITTTLFLLRIRRAIINSLQTLSKQQTFLIEEENISNIARQISYYIQTILLKSEKSRSTAETLILVTIVVQDLLAHPIYIEKILSSTFIQKIRKDIQEKLTKINNSRKSAKKPKKSKGINRHNVYLLELLLDQLQPDTCKKEILEKIVNLTQALDEYLQENLLTTTELQNYHCCFEELLKQYINKIQTTHQEATIVPFLLVIHAELKELEITTQKLKDTANFLQETRNNHQEANIMKTTFIDYVKNVLSISSDLPTRIFTAQSKAAMSNEPTKVTMSLVVNRYKNEVKKVAPITSIDKVRLIITAINNIKMQSIVFPHEEIRMLLNEHKDKLQADHYTLIAREISGSPMQTTLSHYPTSSTGFFPPGTTPIGGHSNPVRFFPGGATPMEVYPFPPGTTPIGGHSNPVRFFPGGATPMEVYPFPPGTTPIGGHSNPAGFSPPRVTPIEGLPNPVRFFPGGAIPMQSYPPHPTGFSPGG